MSLGLLLSVSKSFRAARDLPHRYRAAGQGRLPKFEPAARVPTRNETMKTRTQFKSAEPGRLAGAAAGGSPAPAGGAPGGARSAARWWNPVSWFSLGRWRSAAKGASPGASRVGGGAVQQELALEKVKPCRNDLSDAGWEVAPPLSGGARLTFLKNLAGRAGTGGGRGRQARKQPAARV